ncbi:MAG: hypothetical protein ABI667_06055 [Sphingomicrobium sp.]
MIVGVFIGTQVSNWNADRLQKRETQRMLVQLVPQFDVLQSFFSSARPYYRVTRSYTDVALRGWHNDPSLNDRDFVIAAYQASQIFVMGFNSSALSATMGVDRLKDIDDPQLRSQLSYLMFQDYSQIDLAAVDTPYRRNVRRIIPLPIQDKIRASCGDTYPKSPLLAVLPPRCDIEVSPQETAEAARLLRAHPDLMQDLQWHTAAIVSFIDTIQPARPSH